MISLIANFSLIDKKLLAKWLQAQNAQVTLSLLSCELSRWACGEFAASQYDFEDYFTVEKNWVL